MKIANAVRHLAMWSTVALSAAGCEPSTTPLPTSSTALSRDAGADLPSCEATLGQERVLYQSSADTWVTDVRSSSEGYSLILLENAKHPNQPSLRLVQSPTGKEDVDLTPLLPEGAQFRALSQIRESTVIALYVLGEEIALSQLDLQRRAVAWTISPFALQHVAVPLYDTMGNTVGSVSPAKSKLTTARWSLRVAALGGDRYAILGGVQNGTWLLFGARDGRIYKAINVLPDVDRSFRLAAKPGELVVDDRGDVHILTDLNREDRAAFERIHQIRLSTPDFATLAVVMTFSGTSPPTIHEPSLPFCPAPLRAITGVIDVHKDRLAWSGGCDGKPWVVVGDAHSSQGISTEIGLGSGVGIRSTLINDDDTLSVTGERRQPSEPIGSTSANEAVIARIGRDGKPISVCSHDSPAGETYRLMRSGISIITYDELVRFDDPKDGDEELHYGSTIVRSLAPEFLRPGGLAQGGAALVAPVRQPGNLERADD